MTMLLTTQGLKAAFRESELFLHSVRFVLVESVGQPPSDGSAL